MLGVEHGGDRQFDVHVLGDGEGAQHLPSVFQPEAPDGRAPGLEQEVLHLRLDPGVEGDIGAGFQPDPVMHGADPLRPGDIVLVETAREHPDPVRLLCIARALHRLGIGEPARQRGIGPHQAVEPVERRIQPRHDDRPRPFEMGPDLGRDSVHLESLHLRYDHVPFLLESLSRPFYTPGISNLLTLAHPLPERGLS